LGQLFFVIALILFFLDGASLLSAPKLVTWGLFAMTLGFLLSGVAIPFGR
jgi:cbb3-type cytochrome oxidase subunit 3